MAIIITDDDARKHLSMPECIEAMQVAFRDYAEGKAKTLPRVRYHAETPDPNRLYACNVHVGAGKDQDSFVQLRDARDAQLSMPKLIIPSLQVNMRAGNMPQADANGDVYLKVPINKM